MKMGYLQMMNIYEHKILQSYFCFYAPTMNECSISNHRETNVFYRYLELNTVDSWSVYVAYILISGLKPAIVHLRSCII